MHVIDLHYAPAEGLRAALKRLCEQAEAAVRDGKVILLLVRSLPRAGQLADSCAAGHRRRASSPGAQGPALRRQHRGGDRHRARSPSLRLPDRLRRHRGVSVSGLPDPVRHGAQRRDQGQAIRSNWRPPTARASTRACTRSCPRWASPPSPVIAARSCSRRGPERRSGGPVLHRHLQPHRGRHLRGPGKRSTAAGARGVVDPQVHSTGRLAQVHPRRRVSRVQSGRGRPSCAAPCRPANTRITSSMPSRSTAGPSPPSAIC